MLRFLFIYFVICALNASSQTINYQILKDKPEEYLCSGVGIDLVNGGIYLGAAFGYSIKAEVPVSKFLPSIRFSNAYIDINTHNVANIRPSTKIIPQQILDIGTAFFFTDKIKEEMVAVNLHSTRTETKYYVETETKYINVPGHVRHMFGLEGGIYRNHIALEFEPDGNYKYKRISDGLISPIRNAGSLDNDQPNGSHWRPNSFVNVNSIYFGIRTRSVTNLSINADGWGKRHNIRARDFFFDIMYAPKFEIENVKDIDGAEYEIFTDNKKLTRHLGWKTGFNSRIRFMNISTEIGYKPGPKIKRKSFMDNGFYLNFGFGFFIGTKYGILQNHKTEERPVQ